MDVLAFQRVLRSRRIIKKASTWTRMQMGSVSEMYIDFPSINQERSADDLVTRNTMNNQGLHLIKNGNADQPCLPITTPDEQHQYGDSQSQRFSLLRVLLLPQTNQHAKMTEGGTPRTIDNCRISIQEQDQTSRKQGGG
nr:hypothetical protein Iba_chr12aCG11690 [Ipomoea batatas]